MNFRLIIIIDMFKSVLRIFSKRESKNIFFFLFIDIYVIVYIIWNENFIIFFVVFSNRKFRGIFRRDVL